MITACHYAADGTTPLDLPVAGLREALDARSGVVWVDIEEQQRGEGEAVLRDVFKFHPLTIDDCYNTLLDPAKVDDYGDYLFVIAHDVRYDAATATLETTELDMYLGDHYVVSFHKQPLASVDEVRTRLQHGAGHVRRGAAFLAHALFDAAIDHYHPVVEALDDIVEDVEERVLHQPRREVLAEVLGAKRNAQHLRRSIMPQRDLANRLSHGDFARLIPSELLMYFRDVYDHTMRVELMIDSVRDLADSALNTYLSAVNNRTNEVMKALAIVAVVFLPMTLIASVYGTNFENTFPGYGADWGFYTMLIAFVLITFGLIAWFRFRRWI
jgi:magnesium transporter